MGTNKPTYVVRGGEQELVAPCGLYGSQFYIFLLKANKTNMQNLLDRLFNKPSGGKLHYEAFSDYLAVMFTHVDKLTSSDPRQGWADYGDIAMWIPVIERGEGLIPRFMMYPVYMVVNNGSTMATGREVYGFPKEMGWFVEPQTPDFIGDLAVDVLGYETDSPTQQTIRNRLWTIQRHSTEKEAGFHPLKDLKHLYEELRNAFKLISENWESEFIVGFNILEDLLSVPALGLKQFRDIKDPESAVYQAVVEAPLGMEKFRSARLLTDKFTFTLSDLATHPVAADTGLQNRHARCHCRLLVIR